MVSAISNSVSSLNSQMMAQLRQAQFAKADQNEDGGLSLAEFLTTGPQENKAPPPPQGLSSDSDLFTSFDSNTDGSLSQTELENGLKSIASNFGNEKLSSSNFTQLLQEQFTNADTNSDGALSVDEFGSINPNAPPEGVPSLEDIFASLDSNSDGSLTQDEFEAGAKNGPPPHPPKDGGGKISGANFLQLLSEQEDLNNKSSTEQTGNSSSSSIEEFFKLLDQNSDNLISTDEFKVGQQSLIDYLSEQKNAA